MMENNRLFERYLFKKLDSKELQDFELRLLDDPEFKSEFSAHKKLQHSFDLLIEDEVLEVIQNIKKSKGVKSIKTSAFKGSMKYAAALAVLICALAAVNPAPSGEDIAGFGKGHLSSVNRSNQEVENKTDLPSRITKLNVIESNFVPPVSRKKYDNIIALISSLDKSVYTQKEIDKINWWMAIAQVGLNKENGKKYIEKIAFNSKHVYSKRANEVLAQYSFSKRLFWKISSFFE